MFVCNQTPSHEIVASYPELTSQLVPNKVKKKHIYKSFNILAKLYSGNYFEKNKDFYLTKDEVVYRQHIRVNLPLPQSTLDFSFFIKKNINFSYELLILSPPLPSSRKKKSLSSKACKYFKVFCIFRWALLLIN